ncbi:MAG: DUF2167 domain-containing protein [Proteobacteria bacterium]|nr:DUF2167 domain-containing protein [Pseudomonadota bacterium]
MTGLLRFLSALVLTVGTMPALAQTSEPKTPPTAEQRQAELNAAVDAALKAATPGPADVRLGAQGKVALPAGYQFVPVAEAQRLMRAFGNRTGPAFIGIVLPADGKGDWITTIDFIKAGYVKDDDAKSWNADELLQQLKDGTEAGNADRVARGFREIEVAGWLEPPAYDPVSHRLVWAANVRGKNAPPGAPTSVNYNTYALGREGYYELNLIASSSNIQADKSHARAILNALTYDEGKRYQDFNSATDHVAEYGLAALIAGVAAKKLGLLAAIGVFFLKFWKIAALAFLGLGGAVSKLFKRSS